MLSDGAAVVMTHMARSSSHFPQKGGQTHRHYYQYVMDLVTNVDGTDFAGGHCGHTRRQWKREEVEQRNVLLKRLGLLALGEPSDGLVLEQGAVGFAGNTAVDNKCHKWAHRNAGGSAAIWWVCCDGVTAPKCGDGTGCLEGRWCRSAVSLRMRMMAVWFVIH